MRTNKVILFFFGILLVFLLIVNYFHISYPVQVTNITTSGEFSVVGEGKVDVVPDTANINVGITVNNAASQTDAQNTITTINNKIDNALQQLGIDKKDIKTSQYSIFPIQKADIAINTYNASAMLTVKVTDVNKVSQVIDAATKAGANNIQDTQFVVSNPNKSREEARQQAINNAKEQAQKLAGSLGIRLGKIANITESSSQPPIQYNSFAAAAPVSLDRGSSPQIEPGNQTISSVVTLYYEKQ